MKLKEFIQTTKNVSGLGTNKFRLTLNKEQEKTPHFVMQKVLDILESKPALRNQLRQHCRFLFNDLQFGSTDEKSINFMNEWIATRKGIKRELFEFIFLLTGCGTAYFEPQYSTKTNGDKVLSGLMNFPDPGVIYRNLVAKSEDEYWVMELPYEVREFDGLPVRMHPVYYVKGSFIFRKMVWGLKLPKSKLIQATTGWSRVKDYGWGLLSSAVDNEMITDEVLKNWSLVAKFRSLGKKIIGFYNENGESVDMPELDDLKDQFEQLEEEDSLLVNKNFKSEDLTFNGNDNMLNQEIEYLRKDSGSALTPNYMTAFSQDSSMATAAEAKVPFALELESMQEELVELFNKILVEPIKKAYNLADDLTVILSKPELYSRMENFMNISQCYNLRAATFNELRRSAGLEPVEGGDKWGYEPPLDKTTTTIKKDEETQDRAKLQSFKESFKKKHKELFKPIPIKPMTVKFQEATEKNKKEAFKKEVSEFLNG